MSTTVSDAVVLVETINSLKEPYRRHAIEWLEGCTQSSFSNLSQELDGFLGDLPPVVRDSFLGYTLRLMEEAARYFGARR